MDDDKKCSSKNHNEVKAISYCQECNIYMCNKCEKIHLDLCQNHHSYNLNIDTQEIFTGICQEKNHLNNLEYFCKTHNKLCCAVCITKIKRKGNGQHTDCNVCNIEDIKLEKKNNFDKNIKYLEDLLNTLNKSINELKIIFEKINKNKDSLKLDIQKIFTEIRNKLNEREDELLLEVDTKFDELFFKEDFIKEGEKLPNKVKLSLEKGKKIINDWNNDNNLNSVINTCVNIENNIEYINKINEKINKYNSTNIKIKFNPKFKKSNKINNNLINNNVLNINENNEKDNNRNELEPKCVDFIFDENLQKENNDFIYNNNKNEDNNIDFNFDLNQINVEQINFEDNNEQNNNIENEDNNININFDFDQINIENNNNKENKNEKNNKNNVNDDSIDQIQEIKDQNLFKENDFLKFLDEIKIFGYLDDIKIKENK